MLLRDLHGRKKYGCTMKYDNITFVTVSNDKKVLSENFLMSPLFTETLFQKIVQKGFDNASKAYNEAIKKAENEIIVFAHHDILFPKNWNRRLFSVISEIEKCDENWGF